MLYCEKDGAGAYVSANQAFARRCSLRGPVEVIGRRASDLFPAELAASYEAQDRAVLSTGRSVINHLEVISRSDGQLGWFLTTKVRMANADDEQSLVVVSVDLNAPVEEDSSLDNLSGVLTAVRSEPERAWRVGQLARMAGVGERQLERRMQRLLGCSVKSFLQSIRVERAAQLLIFSADSLAAIAEACGYYDQSQFSRQFRSAKGVTPGQYRRLGGR